MSGRLRATAPSRWQIVELCERLLPQESALVYDRMSCQARWPQAIPRLATAARSGAARPLLFLARNPRPLPRSDQFWERRLRSLRTRSTTTRLPDVVTSKGPPAANPTPAIYKRWRASLRLIAAFPYSPMVSRAAPAGWLALFPRTARAAQRRQWLTLRRASDSARPS